MDTYARLTIFYFLITNKDFTLITQYIVVSKILYNPKLRWHFRIKCICQLTKKIKIENVAWHFRFKVQQQMTFCQTFTLVLPKEAFILRACKVVLFVRSTVWKLHETSWTSFLISSPLETLGSRLGLSLRICHFKSRIDLNSPNPRLAWPTNLNTTSYQGNFVFHSPTPIL